MKEDKPENPITNINDLINFVPKWMLALLGSLLLVFLVFKFIGVYLSVVGNRLIEKTITEDNSRKEDKMPIFTVAEPPYNYREGSELKGIGVDLLKAIFHVMGTDFDTQHIRLMDWSAAYDITRITNNSMLFSMARTGSREDLFKWAGPINTDFYVLIGKKSKNIKIKHIDDIRNYRVGVTAKTAAIQLLKEMGISEYYLDISTFPEVNIDKLSNDKIDLIAIAQSAGFSMIAKKGQEINDYAVIYTLGTYDFYFAFNKNTPDEYIMQFQEALDTLKRTGQYDKILKKYNQ